MFDVQLEKWYEANGRDLPWRRTSDPYLIMLSEFILQQTQISQGMSYYIRFAERFPTAESLAQATEEEVLKLWQGLGYYSRARSILPPQENALRKQSAGYRRVFLAL